MSSRAAAGRKRLQTAPSTPLSPKSRSKFSRFLSPSHSNLVNPELQQPYIVGTPAAYSFPVPETPQTPQQLAPSRDSRKPSYPYPEAVHATSSRGPPPQHSLPPPPPPHKLSDVRTQSTLRSPLSYEQMTRAEDFPVPPALFTTRSNSQPAAQRSSRSPRPSPIVGLPQTPDYQQQDSLFVNYSLPASHSVESIPDTPKPGLRNRSPYHTPASPPRSNTTSPFSSTSGTPTAPSFVSFQSRDTDRTDTSTIQTSPPQSHLSPSPSSSSATIDYMTRPPPGRPSSISSGSHSSGRDSRSSGRVDNIKPPSVRSGNKRDPGFVFPSGRSRAAPGSPTRFKFKSKKQKEKERAEAAQQALLHPVPVKSANQTPLLPGTSVPRSDWTPSAATYAASSSRTPTVYTSSSDGSQGFVFPSSRSRAHPDPAKKLKNGKSGSPTFPETDLGPSSRFMGIPLKKKKKSPNGTPTTPEGRPLSPSYEDFEREYQDSPNTRTNVEPQSQRENRIAPIQRYTKLGMYPLDPYDSVLLESDRQTGELVRQLNGSSTPSFFPYGTNPPATILDLGCGQGHWMLDAAMSWKGYGTKVTGVDIVDVSKNLRMLAIQHGVADNITFIKTNFLQKQLPFPNESFDMVRMSCLTLAISFDRWESVLKEVCRVLTVGGRLELIDDHIFFAYGKSPLSPSPSDATSVPRLDISIPSPRMSTISSIAPSPSTRSGSSSRRAGTSLRDDDSELYDLYEDDDGADTATIHGTMSPRLPYSPGPSSAGTPSIIQSVNPDAWAELAASSKELEALFEHMLNMRYGIHLCPSEFLVGMMERVFGYSREMNTMHLTLATPFEGEDVPTSPQPTDPKSPTSPTSPGSGPTFGGTDSLNPLLHSPGLILWPSTFIPMPQRDVEVHALKHNRTLLSTKLALVEYAVEIGDEDDIEDEGVKEALWDYENFLQQRFNPPPVMESSSSSVSSGTSSSGIDNDDFDQATISGVSINDRGSIFSMSSVTSEGRAAMLEYGSDIQTHFGWRDPGSPSNSSSSRNGQPSMTAPLQLPERRRNQSFGSAASASPSRSNGVSRRDSANSAVTMTSPPNYSRFEPAHVRTFHIYEAIKMEVPPQSAESDDSELPYT